MNKLYKYIVFGWLGCVFFLNSCENNDIDSDDSISDEYAYLQARSVKKGVAFSFQSEEDILLLSPFISWFYNWGSGTDIPISYNKLFEEADISFFPMAWNGLNEAALRQRYRSMPYTHILAYNEPNLIDQAKMTPSEAASKWGKLKAFANEMNVKIVSPAMNYGTLSGYEDPIKWMDEFFACPGVSLDDVDAIALHCYMGTADGLKSFIDKFDKYGKPIWLTEFCAWDNSTVSNTAQQRYLVQAVNMLEQDIRIEKFSWFIPRTDKPTESSPYMQLLTKLVPIGLTSRGVLYTQMSSFDKTLVYPMYKRIPAEHYRSCSIDDAVSSVCVQESTDEDGILQITNFAKGKWVEYRIDIKKPQVVIQLRCATSSKKAYCNVYVDGNIVENIIVPETGGSTVWKTIDYPMELPLGVHDIRFEMMSGLINLNWFRLK